MVICEDFIVHLDPNVYIILSQLLNQHGLKFC